MDADKLAAYETLREVLEIYVRVAAPFAPFITEHIWQHMHAFRGEQASGSVHLTYRPLGTNKYINHTLIEEISTVRSIIKGAMYLRAKHKIKVKQPLLKLEVRK